MILYFDITVLAITTLIGFITFKKSDPSHLKLLRFFLLFDLACDVAGFFLARMMVHNVMLFNIYSVTELSFFLYFLRETIPGDAIRKKIPVLQIVLPLLCLVNILWVQGPKHFQSYTFSIGCLALVTLGVVYLYRLFKDKERIDLLREPAFWVNVGILFFFTSALSIVGIQNYVTNLPRNMVIAVNILMRILSSFFYIFLIIAFVCQRRQNKDPK